RLTAEHWDPQGDEALFTKYQYAHDAADDLLGVSERVTGGSALVQTHAFTRDARGRLATSQQLAGGRVWAQQFAYDDLNRRVAQRVEHFGGSGGATVIPSATVTTANGTLVGSLPGDTVTDFANHYSYDALSRLTRVTQLDRTAEGGTGVPPVGLTYAAVLAKDARLEYNAHGQWTTITRGESGVYVAGLTSATYATAGNPAEVATSRFEYDALARNTKLTHKRESQSGSAALNTYTYVFDAQNRITTMSSLDGGKSFGYDAAGQLILENAVGATEQTYTYDLNGNRARTNQGGVKPVEHAPQNRLLRDGTYQYEYDAEGHRVKRIKLNAGGQPTLEREEFSYDPRDRQTLASLYDATGALVTEVAYEYDAFNNRTARIERTFNPGTGALTGVIVERFVYDGVDVIIDLRGTGATESAAEAALVVKTRYLWADHARAGETSLLLAQEDVVALATTPTVANVLWAFGDHQGTVRDLARLKDTAGVLTIQKAAHYSFDAFGRFTGGQELNAAGTALVTVTGPSVLGANSTRYLYTSQELDRYLRTYHYNRRVYDPGSGVFTITDPIGFAAGDTNLSRYVGNGPVNKTDPSGLYTPNMDANMSGDTVIYNNIQPQPSPPPPSPPPPPSMDELQKLAQGSIRVLRSQREEIYREVAELGQLNENECTTVEELLAKYKKINEKYKAYLNELAVANKRASDLITERTIPGGSQDEALIKEINSFGLIDGLTLDEGATDSLAATFRENMEKSNAQAERLKTIEIALERTQTTIEAIETGTAVYGGVTQLAKCGFKATLAHWIKSEIKNQATQYVMNNYVAKELEAAGIDPNQVALGMRAFAALQSVCFVAGTQVVILPPPNDVKSTDNTVPHATGVPFPLASAAALVGLGLVWQNKQKTSQRQKSQHTLRRKSRPGVPVRVESQASSDDMDPTWPPAAKDSLGATTPESSLVTALATKLPATVTSGDNKATLAPSGMTSPTLAPGRHGIWGGVALLLLAIMAACGFPLMRGALERATVSASLPAHAANRLATKNIEDIVPGDMVWAADPQSGVSGPRRVVEVYRNPTHELLHLTLRGESNGKNLPEFSFVTTREHPFWTTNRGWVAAGELVPGDNVRRLDGTVGQVLGSAVQTLPTPITVYNFQVEGLHTYFVLPVAEGTPVEQDVAGLAFLVHNSCRDPETGRFATDPNKPPESPKGPHGNTADDRPATRYKKYDKDGNFRKHGVTQHEDPSKRYSKAEIDGGRVDDVDRGPRKDMLKDERREVETNPGPDNHEPWAGKNKPK
ncbi:MAG: polymorphic toxin-type HINT domain-containing protein, partial [Pirellulales bacterium]|nr:polymorphic toxin-type HINT domain-containing protein [Pirellulales bacterium]